MSPVAPRARAHRERRNRDVTPRRIAIAFIVLGAILPVLLGGAFVWGTLFGDSGDPLVADLYFVLAGVAGLVAGAVCAYLASRDLAAGGLSRRSRRWAWLATGALVAMLIVFVWAPIWALSPLVTAAFVRLAENRATPAR